MEIHGIGVGMRGIRGNAGNRSENAGNGIEKKNKRKVYQNPDLL